MLTKTPEIKIDDSYTGKVNGFDLSYWPTHQARIYLSKRDSHVTCSFNVEDGEALIVAIRDAMEEVHNLKL